jgi:hypothetical protein
MGILMAVFEVCAAGVTTLRCIQTIRVTGPVREQTTTLMYLLLKQGLSPLT